MARQRFESLGRVAGVIDRHALDVQRGGAGDNDEQPDHAGHHCPRDYVDALIAQILDVKPLIDGVGLDERQAPWRQGRPHRRHSDQDRVALQRHLGNDQSLCRCAPVGVRQESGQDVGDEHGAEGQQDVLDATKGPSQHKD